MHSPYMRFVMLLILNNVNSLFQSFAESFAESFAQNSSHFVSVFFEVEGGKIFLC
jgi:hypothetical protein